MLPNSKEARRRTMESREMSQEQLVGDPDALGEQLVEELRTICRRADLPSRSQASLEAWCVNKGAVRLAEIMDPDHWAACVAETGLRTFEAERLMKELTQQQQEALDTASPPTSSFWDRQTCGRPRRVILVRHGESEANVDRSLTQRVPDHAVHLTRKGREQALEAGRMLKSVIGDGGVKFIISPYTRTIETFNGIQQAWGGEKLRVREDVRIRELEFGNYDGANMQEFHKEKLSFGAFYYRFPSGESPADAYDRASIFLETLYRSWEDNTSENNVIVSHGAMILVLIMRFFRMPVQAYDELGPLKNGELLVLEREPDNPKFEIAFTWAPGEEKNCDGLRKKEALDHPLWDGNPNAPLIRSFADRSRGPGPTDVNFRRSSSY